MKEAYPGQHRWCSLMSTAAHAETVGVSMAKFDDNFLTVLRNGMQRLCQGR